MQVTFVRKPQFDMYKINEHAFLIHTLSEKVRGTIVNRTYLSVKSDLKYPVNNDKLSSVMFTLCLLTV